MSESLINKFKNVDSVSYKDNLLCITYKKGKNNLEEIEKYLPSLLTINKDYFNNLIDFIISTKEQTIYTITDSIFANYVIVCLDEINKNYILLGPYLLIADYNDLLYEYNQYNLTLDEINSLKNYHKDLPILNKHKISNIVKII